MLRRQLNEFVHGIPYFCTTVRQVHNRVRTKGRYHAHSIDSPVLLWTRTALAATGIPEDKARGGSAGELDAYVRLPRNLTVDMGVAIVIVNPLRSIYHAGESRFAPGRGGVPSHAELKTAGLVRCDHGLSVFPYAVRTVGAALNDI